MENSQVLLIFNERKKFFEILEHIDERVLTI